MLVFFMVLGFLFYVVGIALATYGIAKWFPNYLLVRKYHDAEQMAPWDLMEKGWTYLIYIPISMIPLVIGTFIFTILTILYVR